MARSETDTGWTGSALPEEIDGRSSRDRLALPFGSTALYRAWDLRGGLLYVGVTRNPVERWRRHRQRKPWWSQVVLISWECYAKEHLALAAERRAITTEAPRFNRRSAVTV